MHELFILLLVEEVVEEQAQSFESHKPYLLELWKKGSNSDRLEETLNRDD